MDLGQTRRIYTKEFKEETVVLILNRGMSVTQVSKDLSIGTETIYKCLRQLKSDPGPIVLIKSQKQQKYEG